MHFFRMNARFRRSFWVLLVMCTIFILLRIPSLVEPHWYGDEGIYQVIGKAIRDGRGLYTEIWDNKPPVLYFIYALFNGNQYLVRLASLFVGVASVVAFYLLAVRLFKKKLSVYLSVFIYVLFLGLPFLEGNIANAENFMHLPILLAALSLTYYREHKARLYVFLSGLMLSVAFMIKTVAAFEFAAFLLFLMLSEAEATSSIRATMRAIGSRISSYALFVSGFSVMFVLFSLYFFANDTFLAFMSSVFSENIQYVGVGNSLVVPMGILAIKVVLLVAICGVIFYTRRHMGWAELLIYLWLAFGLFSTFFSQRPYPHYILMTALPLSLVIGLIGERSRHWLLPAGVTLTVMIVVYVHFPLMNFYTRIGTYYANYLSFMLGNKSIEEYQAFFDANTPRDYELARFISMFAREGDEVFLWSDSGQIYALSDTLPPGKYIVSYHITYYDNAIEYTRRRVEEVRPRFIIRTSSAPEINQFLASYALRYNLQGAAIYERQD